MRRLGLGTRTRLRVCSVKAMPESEARRLGSVLVKVKRNLNAAGPELQSVFTDMNQDARDVEAKINEIRSGPTILPTILPTQLYVAIAIVRTQTRGFEPRKSASVSTINFNFKINFLNYQNG